MDAVLPDAVLPLFPDQQLERCAEDVVGFGCKKDSAGYIVSGFGLEFSTAP